jgi:hypothetical protein
VDCEGVRGGGDMRIFFGLDEDLGGNSAPLSLFVSLQSVAKSFR